MSKKLEIVMTLPEKDLPSGWKLATIGDIVGREGVFKDGDWVESKDQDPNGDVRLIQLADIGDGEYRDRSSRFLTYEKALELRCTFINKGDVLVARMPDPLGRACIFSGDKKKSVTVVDVCVVRPEMDDISERWLMYFINAPAFRAAVASLQSGSTRKRISRKNLAKISLPVPQSDEQKRIVAGIEKQFPRLDKAVDNLKRVKANLKRYKASVLKAAVEGRLTEEWRAAHPDVEPAEKLLERILAERRKKWEKAESAKMNAKGKKPKDDKWKKKYKEPAKPNLNDLLELHDGWLWVNIDQIMLLLTDYHANGSYKVLKKHVIILDKDAYAIYVRATNLNKNNFDSDLKFVNKKAYDFLTKSKIFGNEIIIGKIGNAGKVYYMPKLEQPCTLGMNLFMLRFNQFLSGKYIYYHLVSFFSEKEIKDEVKGVGNPSIDKNAIRSLRIALPPIREQDQIIKVVDERMSLIAHFENELERHLFRANRLRQSILKKAFSGKLVAQDENDEFMVRSLK